MNLLDFLFVLHQVVANVMSDIVVFILNYFMNNMCKAMVVVNDQNTVNVIRGHDLRNEFLFLCCSKLNNCK
jgi:hypothetical protein